VHRSTTANFTPSASTLVATIRDPSVTTYRDATAAPNKTFTYRIVANSYSSVSNPKTVTLPAVGQARKLLQPEPVAGRNTDMYYRTDRIVCENYGANDLAWAGSELYERFHNALSFDLRDIPANATITSATASA
jgi:hypothetical protein